MEKEESKAEVVPIELVDDLDERRLINFAVLKTLNVAIDAPEKLPYAVNALECVVWDVLRDDEKREYLEFIKRLDKEKEKFKDNFERAMFVSNEKFKFLIAKIMGKTEKEFVYRIPSKYKTGDKRVDVFDVCDVNSGHLPKPFPS